ncbi:hypothetical protein ACTA71_002905 [Dictyostelium dimigraforme]
MKEMKELEREIEQRKELRILKNLKKNKKTNKQLLNWNEWLAGLIDGAGKFTLSKSGYANLDIILGIQDIDCFPDIKRQFGGKIKRRNGLGYVRYRLHRLAGILPLLACVNGHIRHPRRQLEFEQICNHYNIASKIPDKLTSENGWISGYFDAVGLFEFSTEQDQLYLAFRHKINPMLDEIQKCLGVTLPSDVCSCENVTLYNISKKNWLRFYEYFKKHPLRSSKKKHLVLLPKYYELQTDTKDMQNLEVKQNLWKQFFKTCTATMKELEKEQKDAQFHIHMRIKSEQNQFITWLAGLLDSCGNIMLSKKHVSGNIEIKLKLKDHECLEKIKLKYGGAVKVSRTGTRYRLNHQEGLKFLLEDINGQIRLPVRLEKFKEVCKKNEIEMKHPDKELRLDNSWISGFFDGVGSIVINQTTLENKKQLVFTFNHKNIHILLAIQRILGGNIYINTNIQSGKYKYALYFTSKEEILRLYDYFKKYPSRSDKNKRIGLIPQYFDMQTLMLSITDNQLHETLWKKFLCQWDYKAIDEIHSGEILKQKAKLK